MPLRKNTSNNLVTVLVAFILMNVAFDDFGIRWSISIVLFSMLIFLDCYHNGMLVINRSIVCNCMLVFVGSVLFMFMFFDSRKDLETYSYMITLVICGFLIYFAQTDFDQLTKVLRILIAAGTVVAVYICLMRFLPGIYQRVLYFLPQNVREYNQFLLNQGYGVPVGGSIVYADYMISMIIITLFSAVLTGQEKAFIREKDRIILGTVVIITLAAMVFEQRRGEPLCLVASLLLMAFTGINKQSSFTKNRRVLLLFTGIALLLAAFLFMKRFGSSSRFIASTMQGLMAGDVSNGRISRWKKAVEIFCQNPIIGMGWGRFGNYYLGRNDVVTELNIYKYVHNDYLNVLCETGIFGFIIIYIPLLILLILTIKLTKQLIINKRLNIIANPMALTFSYICLGSQYFWCLLACIEPILYKQMFLLYYSFTMICLKTILDYFLQNPDDKNREGGF